MTPFDFVHLRPLIPYRVPEAEKQAEQKALDQGLTAALEYLDRRGLTPGFRENRKEESDNGQ